MSDLTFYYGLFGGWALAAAGLELGSRFGKKASGMVTTDLFKGFRNNYLLVYSLMMGTIGFDVYVQLDIHPPQLATGCRVHTSMPCTATMALTVAPLGNCSSRALDPP